jgi:hypothetical protein
MCSRAGAHGMLERARRHGPTLHQARRRANPKAVKNCQPGHFAVRHSLPENSGRYVFAQVHARRLARATNARPGKVTTWPRNETMEALPPKPQKTAGVGFANRLCMQRQCHITLEVTGAHEARARSARTHLCVRVDRLVVRSRSCQRPPTGRALVQLAQRMLERDRRHGPT